MMLEKIKRPPGIQCPEIKILLRNVSGGNEKAFTEIFNSVLSDCGQSKINLGVVLKEPGYGNIVTETSTALAEFKDKITTVDIPDLIDEAISIKDEVEIDNIYVASRYTCMILDYLNQKFENIINDEKKSTHIQISNETKILAEKQGFQKKFSEKIKRDNLNFSQLEVTLNPIIQSGGKYILSPLCDNDSNDLSSDIIICKVNARYKEYNANIIRTFMIDADKDQQTKYKILYESFVLLSESIKEGEKISDIYKKVKAEILAKDASLEKSIPYSFGTGIGLESSNSVLDITENNDNVIQTGMCFNLILSLSELKRDNFNYCLQIGDTVSLKKPTAIENFTGSFSKLLSDIYYNLDEDEEEPEPKPQNPIPIDSNKRFTRHMGMPNDEKAKMQKQRKEHQLELVERKNEELKNKMLTHATDLNEKVEETKINLSSIKCYESKSQFPSEMRYGKIFIDNKNYTVFLPINKQMIPFHISLIKNVSKSEDINFTVLRINFMIPVSGINFGELKGENPVFIRDISYKNKSNSAIVEVLNQIRELSKNYKAKQQENKEKNDIVKQEQLILNRGKRIALNDVTIRPNISSKKTTGVLEAHTNGLRFISQKGEKVEVIYKNIKHAFLQPCENELIALVHFHFKNPIIIGKKKAHDVQFYKEVGVQADDLDMRRRGNDYEEYEIELKERQMRNKINDEFARFAKNIEEMGALVFDVPFRDLEFTGVPYRSNVTLLPTKNCLVSLVEIPVFVITLSEVDIVYFERVSNNLKNFDMSFIFKDLNKNVVRITTIPMEHLEMIKTWLNENDILFGEGQYNINWPKIIHGIKKDPQHFLDEGGWGFIQDEDDSDLSDGSQDQDSNFEVGEDEEDEDDDDDEESEYSEDSDEESEADEELSEEGLSWDELEKNAKKSDKEHEKKHKEEDKKKKKKK